MPDGCQKEKRKLDCTETHAEYKKNQEAGGKRCDPTMSCEELQRKIDSFQREAWGRGKYIRMGCDGFQWGTEPNTADHKTEYKNVLNKMARCLEIAKAKGCP